VRAKDGRIVRIGDKLIIKGTYGDAVGSVVKIEPTPSGHQLFMVTGRMKKYQYSRRSFSTQVYRFSLDNCTWKKDTSKYYRKPVQKERYKDSSDRSVFSYPGSPKKYQKKKTSCLYDR